MILARKKICDIQNNYPHAILSSSVKGNKKSPGERRSRPGLCIKQVNTENGDYFFFPLLFAAFLVFLSALTGLAATFFKAFSAFFTAFFAAFFSAF